MMKKTVSNICPHCHAEMTDVMFGNELWWMCPICGVLEEYERGNENDVR
jgi:rubredoxin